MTRPLLTPAGRREPAAVKAFARELLAGRELFSYDWRRPMRIALNVVRESADRQRFELEATPRAKRIRDLTEELSRSFSTTPSIDLNFMLPIREAITAELERLRAEGEVERTDMAEAA